MKFLPHRLAASVMVFAFVASIQADERKPVEKKPAEKFPTSDQDFIARAVAGNICEIKLAEKALKQTANKDVEKFAKRMRDDHTKCRDALLERAKEMKLAVLEGLDKEHQAKVDALSKLEGAEFDREYMRCMIEGHEHVLRMYEHWADKAKDADLGAHIRKMIPIVKEHLEEARDVAKKLKV